MTRPARVVIDMSAARANLERVRRLAPRSRLMAVIKADAYGHGLARMARAYARADAFGVACFEEAVRLRDAGVKHPIVLLEGPFNMEEVVGICDYGLDTVVHTETQIEMLEHAGGGRPIPVWFKIDTGMHRLGFQPQAAAPAWQRLRDCAAVAKPLRLMTHLASAHLRGDASVAHQLREFRRVIDGLPGEHCIANSAALIDCPETHADWVRPGLMLYGVSPFADTVAREEGLKPVMTVRSELIAVKQVHAGEAVGYGGAWTCPEDMPVGIVAMGYGDGYPRHAESGTPVLVNGRRAALIGRPSMDMLIVDLRQVPGAHVGDTVILWGGGLPVEEVARHAGTIPYELLCSVRMRARFEVQGDDGDAASAMSSIEIGDLEETTVPVDDGIA